jgi:hypothetical protein
MEDQYPTILVELQIRHYLIDGLLNETIEINAVFKANHLLLSAGSYNIEPSAYTYPINMVLRNYHLILIFQ